MHLPAGELRHWTALVTCDQAIWVAQGTGRGFRDVISFVCVHAYCSLTQCQPAAAAVVLGGEVKQSPMDKGSTTYLISYLSQYRSCMPSASPHQLLQWCLISTQVINHGLNSPHSHCCLRGHNSTTTSHSAGFEATCHPAILSPHRHCAAFKGTPQMQCLHLKREKVGTVFDSILFPLSWFWAPPPLVAYSGFRAENPPWLQAHTQYDSLCPAKPLRFSHQALFVSHDHWAVPCGRAALSPAGTMTHSPVMEPHQPKASCKGYVAEAKLIAAMETSEEWAKWLQLEYLFKLVIHTEL